MKKVLSVVLAMAMFTSILSVGTVNVVSAKGFKHSITVKGNKTSKDFSVAKYTKILYEMRVLYGVKSFTSIKKIPRDVLVQASFSHIYYQTLVDMPKQKKLLLRMASLNQIKTQMKRVFGSTISDTSIKKSPLFNTKDKVFMMWQTNTGRAIYANTVVKKYSKTKYKLTTTIFTSKKKNKKVAVVAGVFVKKGKDFALTKMSKK